MPKFLFWNLYGQSKQFAEIRKKAIQTSLTRLTKKHDLDVLIFAEMNWSTEEMKACLDKAGVGAFSDSSLAGSKINLWTRLAKTSVVEKFNDGVEHRFAIWQLIFPRAPKILLVGCHLHSPAILPKPEDRALMVIDVARTIQNIEKEEGHQHTVLVGDLNMNPYDGGIVATQALHGVMTRELARSLHRLSSRTHYPCFYNPMWSCFGDRSVGPPGSYFFRQATAPTNHFWHLYDQVLIRPDIMNSLGDLELLTTDGEQSFLTKYNRPKKDRFSDHLPLLFELK